MKRILVSGIVCAGMVTAARSDISVLYGFTAESTESQSQWEAKFRVIPDTNVLRRTMELLTAHPHHVGSPYDKKNAEWILEQFRGWGFETEIESFDVLFPTPKERLLEMREPRVFRAKLAEPGLPADPTSAQQDDQLPVYNAYSIDGDVTAPLVYVNYGMPKDYEELERHAVGVKGAIVIARYGKCWRGVKPKVAAEHGAVGCIIYSDPHEDGYFEDDSFPDGPSRNEHSAQRGSVMDISLYPGDPSSPDIPAKGKIKRLAIDHMLTLTRIPTLPISYSDAQPLLSALRGPVAPESFRGALPLTYHLGPGPAVIHLKVQFNWDIKPLYNVIARIPGSETPDQWVIRGNHHDAWVNGASDPVSGQIALLEEARALGELQKQGWKPKRTIIYCAWDGEEPMLLGSTEWVEAHQAALKQHAAIYINSDQNGRGFLQMSGSHSLEKVINAIARDVSDPEANISVWKRAQAAQLLLATSISPGEVKELRSRSDLRLSPLGSGSDFSPFLDHLGIASLDLAFAGEGLEEGAYHSIYDDFYWYTHYSDRDFVYARTLAQVAGTAVLRFADSDVLPYDFIGFADNLRKYVEDLKALLEHTREEARERNQNIDEGLYAAVSDPDRPTVTPPRQSIPPFLNFAPLDNALTTLDRAAEHFSTKMRSLHTAKSLMPESLANLNGNLLQTERRLSNENGLPHHPWYKHLIYAPGTYTGYDAKALPGIREALEEKRFEEAEGEIERVAKSLDDYAKALDAAAAELSRVLN